MRPASIAERTSNQETTAKSAAPITQVSCSAHAFHCFKLLTSMQVIRHQSPTDSHMPKVATLCTSGLAATRSQALPDVFGAGISQPTAAISDYGHLDWFSSCSCAVLAGHRFGGSCLDTASMMECARFESGEPCGHSAIATVSVDLKSKMRQGAAKPRDEPLDLGTNDTHLRYWSSIALCKSSPRPRGVDHECI